LSFGNSPDLIDRLRQVSHSHSPGQQTLDPIDETFGDTLDARRRIS
jgi:hypothetical protein